MHAHAADFMLQDTRLGLHCKQLVPVVNSTLALIYMTYMTDNPYLVYLTSRPVTSSP